MAELRIVPEQGQKLIGKLDGLKGAEPQAAQPRQVQHCPCRIRQAGAILEIPAVCPQMDTGKDDFLEAVGQKLLCLPAHAVQGTGAQRPPGEGDNAVAAEIGAALLNLEKCPGPGWHVQQGNILKLPHLHDIRHPVDDFAVLQDCLLHVFHDAAAVCRAQHHPDTLNSLDLLRGNLGIAAGHGDNCLRILPLDAANQLTGFLVAQAGNGAGVDNVHIRRLAMLHNLIAGLLEKPFHDLGLKLIYLAAKGNKCCTCQNLSPS